MKVFIDYGSMSSTYGSLFPEDEKKSNSLIFTILGLSHNYELISHNSDFYVRYKLRIARL